MFKKMKKMLALMLTVLMLINAMPVSALAEMASEWLAISYSYDDDSEGTTQDGASFTIPVYFYDNVRGKLAEVKTSVTVEYSHNGGGVTLSNSSAVTTVLGDLGTYASAVMADSVSNIASGTGVSTLVVGREGSRNNYTYYLASSSGWNSTELDHEGKNIYIRYTPFNPNLSVVSEMEIATGESSQVVASLLYADAGEATITWASSSGSVTVTPDAADPTKAVIYGAAPVSGATVTVSAAVAGFETATADITVDVVQGATGVTIYHNGENVNGKEFNMETGGETMNLSAVVSPDNATDKSVVWSSSNPTVASVKNGVVTTGNNSGSVTISATASNGVKASVVLHVHAFSLEVEPAVVNIVEEEEFYIYPLISSVSDNWTVTVQPADSSVALALWIPGSGEAVITGCNLPDGAESASTTVRFTLTHTVNGVTESKYQDITVNVTPKAADEYYTVSLFDMSGVLISATSVAEGENLTLPTATQMAVEGYTFNGFKDLEDADGTLYSGTVTNIDRNLILMADYTIIQHKVTFVVHEGDGANPGETVVWVDHGDVVQRPADPEPATYEGYIATRFIDWHDHHDHTLRNSHDFWQPVTEDITLCAHFEEATSDVLLVTFAGTYQTYTFSAKDHTAQISLPSASDLQDIPVTLPENADIEAETLYGYYTDKDETATTRKWSYFRFWQIGGTSDPLTVSSLDFEDLKSYAYDETTGEWHDIIINAVYEPQISGDDTREYQSLNVTVPVRVVTEDGYVLGMGEVYAEVSPSYGVGQGQSSVNGYDTSNVIATTAKFGTVDLNGKDVTITDPEGATATYTIISGEDGNLASDVELVWLCQTDSHVYGSQYVDGQRVGTMCSGGCWNVLGIVTVVVRLHADDLRLRVNYYSLPEDGSKENAVHMKSLFFGNEEGELEAGDVLSYVDYVEGIGQTYSYHSHDWQVGSEGAVAELGSSYVLDIYYTHYPYTVTVHYVDEEGNTVAPDAASTLHKNTYYFIVSPEIEGMEPDIEIVRGKMPGHDLEFTVTYYPVGWLELTKIVQQDKAFNPYASSFAFVAQDRSRATTASLLVNSFTQNSDGSWTGTDLAQLRAGTYAIIEQNASGEYDVEYSTAFVTVESSNTRENPAKITVTNTRKLPVIGIEKTVTSTPANGEFYVEGEKIAYSITVTNTGKAAAESLVVTDALLGISETITLAVDESKTFTGEYTVNAADVARGSVTNVATADNPDITEVSDSVEEPTGENPNPQHKVEKKVVGKTEGYKLGETIHFQIIITNTGNVNLQGVQVVDELVGLNNSINLAVGEDHAHDVYHTVTTADILSGKVVNVVTATYGDNKQEATASVTTEAASPAISVTKKTTSTPEDGKNYGLGEEITYSIVVKNTGNVDLTEVVVSDALTGDSWTIAKLVPGGSRSFTASYQVKASDLKLAGSTVTNTVVAVGKDHEGNDVTGSASVTDPVMEPVTSWTLDKKITSTPRNGAAYDLNEIITYAIVVKNTGNQPITGLKVVDELIGLERTVNLAVGEEKDIEGDLFHQVTSADIANGKVVNIAVSTLEGYQPVSDSETAETVAAVSSYTVDKTVENKQEKYMLGDTVQYKITVVNTGNQPITNLEVVDSLIGLNTTTNLYVGETKIFTGSYVITEADIADGEVVNVVTVGEKTDTETVITDTAHHHFSVSKTITNAPSSGEEYALNEEIKYSFTITNTGNQTLAKLDVEDALLGYEGIIENLAVGQSVTIDQHDDGLYLTYKVTEADIAAGEVVNVVSVSDGEETRTATAKAYTASPYPHVTIEKEETSSPADGEAYKLGETITYKITVTNTGNVKLTQLNVKDAKIGLDKVIDLSVGASASFTGSHVVTEADVVAGEVVNVATAGKVGSDKTPVSDEVTVPTEGAKPGLSLVKQVTSTPANGSTYALGELVTYSITVSNTGNVTLNNVVVTDPLIGLNRTISTLGVKGREVFTGSYRVTANDILARSVVNTASAAAVYGETKLSAEDTATIYTEGQTPAWTITKKAVNGAEAPFGLGEVIKYEIAITNTGNVALTGLKVVDELIGLERSVNLAIGATVTLTGEYTVTEADIQAGTVKNTAYAGEVPSNEVTVDVEDPDPKFSITKNTTSTPANGKFYTIGEEIRYMITVKNTGNVTVENIQVVDELIGLKETITLKVGATEDFTGSYKVTEADILSGKTSIENVAIATYGDTTEKASTEDPIEAKNEKLAIEKKVTSTPANGVAYAEGERVTYQITVTNTGNVTLKNLTVEDPLTHDTWEIASLAPGKYARFTTSYLVLEKDILAGEVQNVATVKDENDQELGRDDETVPTETADARIDVDKITTSTPANGKTYAVGEVITYQITVKNTGNVTLTNVKANDSLTGDQWDIGTMEPGASRVFTARHIVFEDDVLVGKVVNTATATGTDPEGNEKKDSAAVTDPTDKAAPSIQVVKTITNEPANGAGYAVGEEITYGILVSNNGNLRLMDIEVKDSLTGDAWEIEALARGASKYLTTSYKVTEADVKAGSVLNVVTAAGTASNNETVTGKDEAAADTVKAEYGLTVKKEVTSKPKYDKYRLGETITYKITVTNEGNVAQEVNVVDALIGLNEKVTLAAGESKVFSGSYVVKQADVDAGFVRNVATANDEDDEVIVDTEKEIRDLTISKTVTNLHADGTPFALGEKINYQIVVKNTGNVELENVAVEDSLIGLNETIALLNINESKTFTGSYTVQEEDILRGYVKNVATAGGEKDEVTVDIEDPDPDVSISKATTSRPATGGTYALGEVISYRVTVRNTGNVKLDAVEVVDSLIGLRKTISLEIGESETFTGSYTVQEKDIRAGRVVNVATAMGETATVTDPTDPVNESLDVKKYAIGKPADGKAYKLGETIRYQIVVSNTGNVTQYNIPVADELTGDTWNIASLSPGRSTSFTTSYVVLEKDILNGRVYNVAVAGDEQDTEIVETEDPKPAISVDKTTVSTPDNGRDYIVGEVIDYKIVVKNEGNVTLTNISVVDPVAYAQWTIESLAPGASRSFDASREVFEDDVIVGHLVNTASAEGEAPGGEKVSNSDSVTDPTEDARPAIQVIKTITSTPAKPEGYAVGEEITYDILVKNTGNLRLNRVDVVDELTGDVWYIESLPRGASKIFSANYTVTEDDLVAGSVLNVATAKGSSNDPKNPTVSDEDQAQAETEPANPEIKLVKTVTSAPANGEAYRLDEVIAYRIVVSNTGNLTVRDIRVQDELTDDIWNVETLSPGQSVSFTAEYTVTEADLIAGSVLNVATAKGTTPGGDPEDEDEIETDVEDSDPGLKITKIVTSTPVDGITYKLGEVIEYRIVAHNTGNITISDIEVKDDLTNESWKAESLAPGKAIAFTTSYVVTEDDLIAGSVVNVATGKATTKDPDEPTVEDEDEIETDVEDSDPGLKITKIVTSTPANGVAYKLGEVIEYRIVAHNTGNITISDIEVKDDLTNESWKAESLAPGKAIAFTTSYVVTEDDLIAGSVVNVATGKATTKDPDEPTVEDEDEIETDVEDSDPRLKITKIVTSTPADGVTYKLNETISYKIVVQNMGNISVSDVVVEDTLTGDIWNVEILAPGQAEYFTAVYVVTEDDLIAGSVVNVATGKATTKDPDEPTVEDEDEIETDVEDSDPAVEVIKTVLNPKEKFKLDETIEYQIEVKNTGNITVSGIIVNDELTGDSWTIESLAPGASAIFTAKYIVTKADTREGKVLNVAVASGTSKDPEEPTVEDEGEVEVEIAKIVIEKAALGNVVMNVGDCFE